MAHEPNDPVKVRLSDPEWARMMSTLFQYGTYPSVQPIAGKIIGQPTQHGVILTATEWNQVLSLLQKAPYEVIASLIVKVSVQGNAEPPPENGLDAGEFTPGEQKKPERPRRVPNA